MGRRFIIIDDFQSGAYLWQEGYDGYLEACAGEVAQVVDGNANGNEFYFDCQIGDRRGYIPCLYLTDIGKYIL